MSDRSGDQSLDEAEMTSIPVHGECGHTFPVPLARLLDGAAFPCPACGKEDRVDHEALRAAEGHLERLRSSGVSPRLQEVLDQIIATSREA